ncbi:pyridoxamine 5'-phosphate oxidase family protein [Mumia sp. ZJ1417]|uniref:pyridoxamine 5'-phosphate oxidase family protein n=1 Tax=Mumia sp. ZJ1417 TaxID=2708082 RepID=UPI00141DD0C9|nr:pyridoxamine 5'-phosphate oxidase family protein [Mumia sp. ZJ1417]QMW66831.1 pyridoxamine 5'-phosphate oxidase family protein [Mumia sp. ZJ1417]
MSSRALVTLDAVETKALLGTARVGHLAYQSHRGLDVTPVNYRLCGDTIYIRTVEDGTLAALAPGPAAVAFLVTYLDRLSQTGWSVKVRGKISAVDETVEIPDVDPEPWTGLPGTMLLALTIDEMTGRRVG